MSRLHLTTLRLPHPNKRMLTAITVKGPGRQEKQDILEHKRTGGTLQSIGALATGTAPFEGQPVNFRPNSGSRLQIGRYLIVGVRRKAHSGR